MAKCLLCGEEKESAVPCEHARGRLICAECLDQFETREAEKNLKMFGVASRDPYYYQTASRLKIAEMEAEEDACRRRNAKWAFVVAFLFLVGLLGLVRLLLWVVPPP